MMRRKSNLVTRTLNRKLPLLTALTVIASAGFSISLPAQTTPYFRDKDFNTWLKTDNPVSLGITTMPNAGQTSLNAKTLSGDFHKAMESGRVNAWGFDSYGSKSLKPLNLWGRFNFSQERHQDRCWSDNIRPYNGNPYLTGSSVKGNYSYQLFDFSVRMSSKQLFDFMWTGIGLDYSLGDFSRLQDPRSRTQEIVYTIKPGVAFRFGKEKIGLNLSYGYSKEKIGSYVSKSKDSKEYLLYLQEGLGVYSILVSNAYDRRIESWKAGAALQYEHSFGSNSVLLGELSPFYRKDSVEDAYGATPGNYKEAGGRFFLAFRSGNWRSESSFSFKTGSAKKITQKSVTVTDPSSGVTSTRYETIFSIKSYTAEKLSAETGLSYVVKDTALPWGSKWNAGCKVRFNSDNDEYVYYSPVSSFARDNIVPYFYGGGTVLATKGHFLMIDGEFAYRVNLSDNYSISDELRDKVILDNVISPDREIMTSDFLKVSATFRYVFPLPATSAGRRLSGFTSLSASMCFVPGFEGSGRNLIGVSVGILH